MDGYLEYHKTICSSTECPSKKSIEKNNKLKTIWTDEEDTGIIIRFYYLIEKIF